MSEYTPGPWLVPRAEFIEGETGYIVCQADGTPLPASMADARLIAAAPDLLEALEKVLPLLAPTQYWKSDSEAVAHARAAVTRARGE